jgi:hypothetical protein
MSQINKGDKNSQRIVIRPEKHNQSDDDYVMINPDWLPSVPYSKKPLSNPQPSKVVSEAKKVLPKKEVPPPKKEVLAMPPPKKILPPTKKEVPPPKKEVLVIPPPKKEVLVIPPPKKELRILTLPKKEVPAPKKEALIIPPPKKELRILTLPKKEVPVPKKEVPVPKKEVPVPKKEVPVPKKEVPVPKKEVTVPKKEVPVPKKEVPVPKKEVPAPKKEVPVPKKEVPAPKTEVQLIKLPKRQQPIIIEEEVIPQQRIEIHPGRLPTRAKPVVDSKDSYAQEISEQPMLQQIAKLLRPVTLPKRQAIDVEKTEVVPKKIEIPIPIVPRPRIEIHPLMVRKRNTPIEEKPPIVVKVKTNEPLIKDVIATLNYNTPVSNDLAVLLVFFDYIGSVRILMNYLFMREKLKLANIPVFTLELVMEGEHPKISDAIHVYGSSYLFQKEHLLRLLEKQVPQQFTKLACLDADVLFDDPEWYDKLSTLLDTYQVVQCFKTACWLDLTYTRMQKKAHSCVRVADGKRFYEDPNRHYHPGYGWAFTRDWYNKSGFYDLAVIGSGDTLFSYGIMGHPAKKTYETRIYYNSYSEWLLTLGDVQRSFLPVTLYHLYHGPTAKRQYVSRYASFEKYNQIEDCLAPKNADGVYELLYPELNSAMFEVFKTRDDDGTD